MGINYTFSHLQRIEASLADLPVGVDCWRSDETPELDILNDNWSCDGSDAIRFSTSLPVAFRGIKCVWGETYKCTLSLWDADQMLVQCNFSGLTGAHNGIIDLKLLEPIALCAERKYDIVLELRGADRAHLRNGATDVCTFYDPKTGRPRLCARVKITFEDSPWDTNGTDVSGGQIPGLLLLA